MDNVQTIQIQKLTLDASDKKVDFSKCPKLEKVIIFNIDTTTPDNLENIVKKGVKVIAPQNVKVKIIEVD